MNGYRTTLPALAITLAACVPATHVANAADTAPTQRVAPATHCLDTRDVRRTFQGSDSTLAVVDGQGRGYRIRFTQACPGVEQAAQVRMEAVGGWACGHPAEQLLVDGRACEVASVTALDARELAEDARLSSQRQPPTLPTVQVSGEADTARPYRRSFIPSHTFCFAQRNVRGWSEDDGGILVLTSPRRSGGNSQYLVETGGHCPDVARASSIGFESGLDNGMICGNPGDRVVPVGSGLTALAEDDFRQTYTRQLPSLLAGIGCQITAVYPKQ